MASARPVARRAVIIARGVGKAVLIAMGLMPIVSIRMACVPTFAVAITIALPVAAAVGVSVPVVDDITAPTTEVNNNSCIMMTQLLGWWMCQRRAA